MARSVEQLRGQKEYPSHRINHYFCRDKLEIWTKYRSPQICRFCQVKIYSVAGNLLSRQRQDHVGRTERTSTKISIQGIIVECRFPEYMSYCNYLNNLTSHLRFFSRILSLTQLLFPTSSSISLIFNFPADECIYIIYTTFFKLLLLFWARAPFFCQRPPLCETSTALTCMMLKPKTFLRKYSLRWFLPIFHCLAEVILILIWVSHLFSLKI